MRKFNQQMIFEIARQNWVFSELNSQLKKIVEKGFIEREKCFFLKELFNKSTNATQCDFPDETGYECFINTVHIDDYVEKNYIPVAWKFAEALIQKWRTEHFEMVLSVIVSSDEMGATVKCHLVRKNQSWIASDLNKYKDAVMIVDSRFTGDISMP